MWGIFNAFQAYLIYLEKSRLILYISVAGMTASLTLNSILVPRMGADGAAWVCVATYTLMAIICFLTVRKHFFNKTEKISAI